MEPIVIKETKEVNLIGISRMGIFPLEGRRRF
jgi:hypothetical protein